MRRAWIELTIITVAWLALGVSCGIRLLVESRSLGEVITEQLLEFDKAIKKNRN